jgi:hypothetical protein
MSTAAVSIITPSSKALATLEALETRATSGTSVVGVECILCDDMTDEICAACNASPSYQARMMSVMKTLVVKALALLPINERDGCIAEYNLKGAL